MKNGGGVGYKDTAYKDHEYKLPSEDEKPLHLTTRVAVNKIPVRNTVKELQEKKANGFPYTGACEEYIGEPLRNLLALPVEADDQTVAVVKLENKLPFDADFDELDELIYSEFSTYVVTSLLPRKRQGKSVLAGVELIIKTIGSAPSQDMAKRDPERYNELFKKVNELHLKHPGIVTVRSACAYFKVAKGTWYAHVPKTLPQRSQRKRTVALKKRSKR